MGYSLTIGELKIEYDNDNDCPRIHLSADGFCHGKAPAFGEPTDKTSSRWASYSSWREFCRFVDLEELFYGAKGRNEQSVREDYLILEHPGCIPLTEQHRKEINAAMVSFQIRFPNAIPTYGKRPEDPIKALTEGDPNNPEENGQMCRLVWLQYWVNWVLDNCQQPVFQNS